MAIRPDYQTGTIDLVASSADFTTTGAALQMVAVQPGDAIITPSGHVLIIATITGQNSGTLFLPCPAAAAGAGLALRIRFQPDGSRYQGAVRNLIDLLSSGNLEAIAALVGSAGLVPIFTGPGTLDLADPATFGVPDPNSSLSNLASITDVTNLTEIAALEGAENEFISFNSTGAAILVKRRLSLLSDATVYISPTGNDGAKGTSAAPFQTASRALDYIYKEIDLNGYAVKLKLGDGVYSEDFIINGVPVGAGNKGNKSPVTIEGNVSSPSSVIIGSGAGTALSAINGGVASIAGIRFASNSYGVFAEGSGALISVDGAVEFMSMTYDHFFSRGHSSIYIKTPYKILGGGQNHFHSTEGGFIGLFGAPTVTLEGTPAFTGQFAGCASSEIVLVGATFSGSATGRRYLSHYSGTIRSETNNPNFLPGNLPGIEEAGGRFDYAPSFSISRQGSNVSLPASTATFVEFNTIDSNVGGLWNSSGWAQPRGGAWAFSASVTLTGMTAGTSAYLIIQKNGSTQYRITSKVASGSQETFRIDIPFEKTTGNDTYQVYVRYDGSGASILAGGPFTYFTGVQL